MGRAVLLNHPRMYLKRLCRYALFIRMRSADHGPGRRSAGGSWDVYSRCCRFKPYAMWRFRPGKEREEICGRISRANYSLLAMGSSYRYPLGTPRSTAGIDLRRVHQLIDSHRTVCLAKINSSPNSLCGE